MDSTTILIIGMTLGMALGAIVTYIAMHHDAQHTQRALYDMYLDEREKRYVLEARERSSKAFRDNKVRIIKRIDGEVV